MGLVGVVELVGLGWVGLFGSVSWVGMDGWLVGMVKLVGLGWVRRLVGCLDGWLDWLGCGIGWLGWLNWLDWLGWLVGGLVGRGWDG